MTTADDADAYRRNLEVIMRRAHNVREQARRAGITPPAWAVLFDHDYRRWRQRLKREREAAP